MAQNVLSITGIIAIGFLAIAYAYDPSPLQDFCVADLTSPVKINGLPCKDPAKVTPNDFFFTGLNVVGKTTNPSGSAINPMNVARVPGLNTLGITLARLDFAPNGFISPHLHVRGSEVLTILEGSLEVGFVTSYPDYKHFTKVLEKGDAFVFPVGRIHYYRNVGTGNTAALAVVNSQNSGVDVVTNAVFGPKPAINSDYLARAFQLDKKIIEDLQNKF